MENVNRRRRLRPLSLSPSQKHIQINYCIYVPSSTRSLSLSPSLSLSLSLSRIFSHTSYARNAYNKRRQLQNHVAYNISLVRLRDFIYVGT